jgi:hypothetical protein
MRRTVIDARTTERIRLAAEIARFSAQISSRDDLVYAYWVLLQATGGFLRWPPDLCEEYLDLQAEFFRYGLPPQTVRLMSDEEAEAAAERIEAFADLAAPSDEGARRRNGVAVGPEPLAAR